MRKKAARKKTGTKTSTRKRNAADPGAVTKSRSPRKAHARKRLNTESHSHAAGTHKELPALGSNLQARSDQGKVSWHMEDAIFATSQALAVLDEKFNILRASNGFCALFNLVQGQATKLRLYEIDNAKLDIPELRVNLERIRSGGEYSSFKVTHTFPGVFEKTLRFQVQRVEQAGLNEKIILFAIDDVTQEVLSKKVLMEQEIWFRNVANNAPVMIWTSDAEGNRIFFNHTWLEFTGKKMEEEKGMAWIAEVNPEDRETLISKYKQALDRQEPYQAEYRLLRNDGEYRWMLSSAKPLNDAGGKFLGLVGTVTEVHDQKIISHELEAVVQMRTEALLNANRSLEHTNSELQQFAYVASHDLQEPLRKIIMFSERLQEKFKPQLPDDAKQYLDIIAKGASRMTVLIDDLLAFSRAVQKEKEMIEVDLNSVFKKALHDFDVTIQVKNAVVEAEKLPRIKAVPVQMHQLFHNLISNALKFTLPSVSPRLKITQRTLTREEVKALGILESDLPYCDITFHDNGIGFEEDQLEKIFTIFYRLHDRQKYPGTGIGLALCRKIVNNHSGVIYAESEVGKGSAFHVVLPLC